MTLLVGTHSAMTPTASAVARIIVLAMGWGLFLVTR